MFIKKLYLKDYKRFHDLTIDLGNEPQRIVALVGPNGCGKSSVFDGMLYNNNSYNCIGKFGIKNYSYHSLQGNSGYSLDNIKIDFVEGNFFEVYQNKRKDDEGNTIFSFRSSFRHNGLVDVRESKAVSDLRDNCFGASSTSDIDEKMEENYRRLNIKYNKYMNEHDCRPSEAKGYIIGELNNAISNCLNLEIDNLGNIEAGDGTIFFKKSDTPKAFEFDVLSAGEKEVVDILLDLYLRKDVYDNSIYIIDEPELHINTAIQRKLILEINKMVPKNCQIWIATHSIGFLRALQKELNDISQIIEFKEENMWASESYVLGPMIKSRNNWINLFSTALDDLTGLVSPKTIVYCEGRAEPRPDGTERGLDAEVYNTIFGEKYPDVLFVSSGGNNELEQRSSIAISILSKVFSDVEILVLKDRDMDSRKLATEEDRQDYLDNNENHCRVLKRFEIENYLFDKEVLREYCSQNNKNFDEEGYDSFVNDIMNQQVKDNVGRIKKLCDITVSISPDKFKKNLAKYINPSMNVFNELEDVIFYRK